MLNFYIQNYSGRFDSSGSMIPLLLSKISGCFAFCDVQQEEEQELGILVQLGSSSRAIHGGAYFSAVFGRKFNPTTVLRPCQPLACYWRVGIAPAPTLFTTSAKHHGSR